MTIVGHPLRWSTQGRRAGYPNADKRREVIPTSKLGKHDWLLVGDLKYHL